MQCVSFIQQGQTVKVQLDSPTTNGCPSLVVLNQSEYNSLTLATVGTLEPVTSQQVQQVFVWGFSVVILFWFFGYGVGVAKKMISKI